MIDAPVSPPISPGPPPPPAPKPPVPAGPGGPPESAEAPNTLTLDPNLFSKAKGDSQCKPGDTYTVQLTVRANDAGNFDVVDTEPLQMVDSATGSPNDPSVLDDAGEEAVLGYKRPKKSLAGPQMV